MGKYITLIYDEPYTSEHVGENIYRMVNSTKTFTATELATLFTPYTEPDLEQVRKEAYEHGLSDAWDAARKIANIPYGEEEKVIGSDGWTFIVNHTVSEAIEKIRQYEQEKEEQIQVGDEVIYDGRRCVVIRPETFKKYGSVMDAEGRRYGFENKEVEKTGRHFPEIAEVFAKMKEKE